MTPTRIIKHLWPNLLWLVLAPTPSWAVLNTPITLDFNTWDLGAYYGKSNTSAGCTAQPCFAQYDFIVGTPDGDFSTHLHQNILGTLNDANGNPTGNDNVGVAYHNDSAGIYIRAVDFSAFSMDSFKLFAPISLNNKQKNGKTPPQDSFYEIIGFSEALIPDATTFGWGSSSLNAGISIPPNQHPQQVAYQSLANGFTGTVVLNDNFKNVKAVWIHYGNYPKYPIPGDNSRWVMVIDDVQLSKPLLPGCQ